MIAFLLTIGQPDKNNRSKVQRYSKFISLCVLPSRVWLRWFYRLRPVKGNANNDKIYVLNLLEEGSYQ